MEVSNAAKHFETQESSPQQRIIQSNVNSAELAEQAHGMHKRSWVQFPEPKTNQKKNNCSYGPVTSSTYLSFTFPMLSEI